MKKLNKMIKNFATKSVTAAPVAVEPAQAPLGLRVVKPASKAGDTDVADFKKKEAKRVKAEVLTSKPFEGLKDFKLEDPFFNCKK